MSPFRIWAWLVLAFFTPILIQTARFRADSVPSDAVLGTIIFFLITEVTCLLGLLLWATPLILTELEANSWLYAAVRPGGRVHLLIGKYLNAVVWVFLAAFASISLTAKSVEYLYGDALLLWGVVTALSALASLSYGALFCLLAVAFPRRSMVIAVANVLIFEFLLSFLPATVNRLTVLYRLRSLLVQWMGWYDQLDPNMQLFLSDAPAWQNVLFVLILSAVYLGAAVAVVQFREYLTDRPE